MEKKGTRLCTRVKKTCSGKLEKNILRRSHLRNIAAAVVVHTLSVIATAGEWDCRVNGHAGGDGWMG